ncbi:uncharacterized protein FFMR_05919 [Fusarium fujikuroi]|nr:uncharacterized protein FFMR_05919 [Fusarium fujikuroi]
MLGALETVTTDRTPSFASPILFERLSTGLRRGAFTGRDINQRNIQHRIIVYLAMRWKSHNFPAKAQALEKDISEAFISLLDNYIINFHPQSGSQSTTALSPSFPPELREMVVKLLDASSLDAPTKTSKQCRQLFGPRSFYHMAFRGSEKVVEQGLKTLLRSSAHILPRPLGQVRQALQEMPLLSISVNFELASPTLPGRLARGLRCLMADRVPQVGRQPTWESLRVAWDISSHDIDKENFYHMLRDMCIPESLESLHVHEDINLIFTSLIRTVRFANLKRLFAVPTKTGQTGG